jgi:large subunit ribosomal protein L25
MGDKITLTLDPRDLLGKKARLLRKQGIVPAIIYGPGVEPINAQAEYNVIEKVWRRAGKHTPIQLTVDGKKNIALIKDVDIDPAKNRLRHVSFHAVKANDPVIAEVPIRLIGEGESEAERVGLVVLQSLEHVEVRALPMDLPEAIEIPITGLKEAGDRVTLGEAVLPPGVELVEHKTGHGDEEEDAPQLTDLTVATVYEPSALQAANEKAAGDAEDESEVEAEQGADAETTEGADGKADDASDEKS